MIKKTVNIQIAAIVEGLTVITVPKHSLPFSFDLKGKLGFPREDSILLVNEDNTPVYFSGHNNDIYVHSTFGREESLPMVPDYLEDWAVTGPLIEEHGMSIYQPKESGWPWRARSKDECYWGSGTTILKAVCELIISLHMNKRWPPKGRS